MTTDQYTILRLRKRIQTLDRTVKLLTLEKRHVVAVLTRKRHRMLEAPRGLVAKNAFTIAPFEEAA